MLNMELTRTTIQIPESLKDRDGQTDIVKSALARARHYYLTIATDLKREQRLNESDLLLLERACMSLSLSYQAEQRLLNKNYGEDHRARSADFSMFERSVNQAKMLFTQLMVTPQTRAKLNPEGKRKLPEGIL